MKTLEAGTTKYLLLDPKRIERNAERGKLGEPIVIVLEELPEGIREHRGVNLMVDGPVTLAYDQRGFVAKHNYDRYRAAYMTISKVLLAETHGENLVITDGVVEQMESIHAGGSLVLRADIDVSDADFVANPDNYDVITDEMADAADAAAKQDSAPTTPKKTTRKSSAK